MPKCLYSSPLLRTFWRPSLRVNSSIVLLLVELRFHWTKSVLIASNVKHISNKTDIISVSVHQDSLPIKSVAPHI